uniref:amino acid transporter AVT6E-like n=1 Tax=Erigeron canadensis TaxID=72917 RepID=UPI001CB91856|nr:amino acid transporter AVT6E-like [Erigeron canadensis]
MGSQERAVQNNSITTNDRQEEDDNNDYSNENSHSGFYGAVFNLVTTVIGAGIMALPATMKVLGLIVGVILILLMGIITEVSVEMLIRYSVHCNAKSYGEVVQHALGTPGRIISELFIIMNNAGVLVVYMIIIGDVMSGSDRHVGVLDQWFGKGFWDERRLVMLIVLVVCLAPLCALDRIESLSMTSGVSVALAVLFVMVTITVAFIMILENKIGRPRLFPDISSEKAIIDLLVVIPIMSNAYVCHFNIQPIYNELEGRSPKKMNKVGRVTTIICVFIYWATAVSGYLLFGDKTESDVLTNFDKPLGIRFSTGLNYIVRVGYILHLVLVFPVIHFSLRQTIDALAFSGREPLTEDKKRCLLLTCAILIIVFMVATLIPSIWTAFKFTGAVTAISLAFTFPALIALRFNHTGSLTLTSREKIFAWIMLVLAVIISIVGVFANIYGLQSGSRE